MIRVRNLKKIYDGSKELVLDGISFSLDPGETLSIICPSGCGKTTLLYILAGLTQATSGEISLKAKSGEPAKQDISFVLQDFGLFPWKTVIENVSLCLELKHAPPRIIKEVTEKLLSKLGLETLRNRYPSQVSGGQKQRVAIARALASDPAILLLDEPFSSLDALTRESLQNTLLDLWLDTPITYAIVTHSIEEAVFLGKHIMVLTDQPTRIRKLVANEGFGTRDFRLKDEYFSKIKEIRSLIEYQT